MATNDGKLEDMWLALEDGDLETLKIITPANFDWQTANTNDGRMPLQELVMPAGLLIDPLKWKLLARWLLDHGADPLQANGHVTDDEFVWRTENKGAKILIRKKGRSAMSTALQLRKEMRDATDGQEKVDWTPEIAYLSELIQMFSRSVSARDAGSTANVKTSVIERWASMLQDTSDHSLTINAEGGRCTAHGSMLSASSPVVKACLNSGMVEGSKRSIDVKDCPVAAVRLLLELLYTGGIAEDIAAATAMHTLLLAHRWQIGDVVRMVENLLAGLLTDDNFVEIASKAELLSLPVLKAACISFSQSSSAIQKMQKSRSLPEAVMKLLGISVQKEKPAPKKRRML
eukprot:gb/GFBE01000752.1/.p1 GENE.gb/GFBE01000752.1/~~gb/GFBE01000752.1/.p1  ORF type:complete len:345 (+),score=86.08 gb/GFBE01000752.1/:1-1035(+)